MPRLVPCALFCLLLAAPIRAQAPASVAGDPWVGTFTDGALVVRLQGTGGQYTGVAELSGERYAVTARASGGTLTGWYRTAEGEFPFTAQRSGDTLVVAAAGVTYTLRRLEAAAAAGHSAVAPPAAAAGALHDGTATGREWAEFLAGKKVTRLSNASGGGSGGYSSETNVHLCGNGEFALRGSNTLTVDVGAAGGYSAGRTAGQGTWRIVTEGATVGIELRFPTGDVERHRLEYQESKTYVDGERWFVTPSEVCGG
jgi:hypothetical protein